MIYDRAGSAFALSAPEEYDWDAILSGADWVHFTGITPALGPNAAAVAECACKKAKARNICISCDVNYRSKLWGVEQARAAMEKLLPYTDVCIINENQAKELFGVEGEKGAREMAEKFSLSHVAFTYRRTQDALRNKIWGELYTGGKLYRSREYAMEMVDRIGGGDAFAAGLIYSVAHGFEPQYAVDFAEAASCLKHSVEGDFCIISLEEVKSLCAGNAFGIKR